MNKALTLPSKRGHNLLGNKIMQTEHIHCDKRSAYIIKVPTVQKQRLQRESEGLSNFERNTKCA